MVALLSMAHSFTGLHKPLCHHKAVIHEGDIKVYLIIFQNKAQEDSQEHKISGTKQGTIHNIWHLMENSQAWKEERKQREEMQVNQK